ncbi:sodium-dependent transporter, partial [Turicibacter sanguinis]|nr:sodium-dependent transporter [Turicibacter sanguinis]
IKYLCPVIFLFISVTYLITNLTTPYDGYPVSNLIAGGWGIVLLTVIFGIGISLVKGKNEDKATVS